MLCCKPKFSRCPLAPRVRALSHYNTDKQVEGIASQRKIVVCFAASSESCGRTALHWAKRPDGGRPVRQFMENKRKQPHKPELNQDMEILIKVVAATGISTYKKAHAIILGGMVKVNGTIVKHPTNLVHPRVDDIYIQGSMVQPKRHHNYIMVNKRAHTACSTLLLSLNGRTDPKCLGQMKGTGVGDGDERQKLLLVGRLDYESCGLQLLSTDPDWAERVTRCAEVQQEFIATVSNCPSSWQVEHMASGCAGKAKPVHVSVLCTGRHPTTWRIRVVLKQTRARDVWGLISSAGLRCLRLQRVRFGSACLPHMLKPGEGVELAAVDVHRVLDSQAARSIIINTAKDMLLTGSVKPFRLSRRAVANVAVL